MKKSLKMKSSTKGNVKNCDSILSNFPKNKDKPLVFQILIRKCCTIRNNVKPCLNTWNSIYQWSTRKTVVLIWIKNYKLLLLPLINRVIRICANNREVFWVIMDNWRIGNMIAWKWTRYIKTSFTIVKSSKLIVNTRRKFYKIIILTSMI